MRAHELLGDLEVDVGLEEGAADFAQALLDVLGREGAVPAELAEDVVEFGGEGFEHGGIVA